MPHVLDPVLLPLGALSLGAFISAIAPRFSELARRWLAIAILLFALVGLLFNAMLSSRQIEFSTWDDAALSLTLRVDGIALVLLAAIFVSLIALQFVRPTASLDSLAFFVLLASALLIYAGNLLTTVFAWAGLDLALYAWRAARRIPHDAAMRALILGQLAGLALFAGAILLDVRQMPIAGFLIALAFWARLGLFPFHWIYPSADLQTFEFTAIRGASIAAGASLWLRWSELNSGVPSELIALLASLTFIAAIVRSASTGEALEKISANAMVAIAFIPIAVAFCGDAANALALAITLGVVFALAMFELGLAWQADAQNRWARLFFAAGIFAMAGTPLTPAFLGRVGAFVSLVQNGQGILFLLAGIVATIAPIPLWRISASVRGAAAREPTRGERLGLQILGLAFIGFGFGAGLIAQVTGNAAERALDLVIRTDDYFAAGLAVAALVASLTLSFGLARVDWGYHPQGEEIAQFAARVMELDWLGRALTRLGNDAGALAQNFSALAEENPTVWILFAALWIAIFILTTR